jgi:hypothetical protein
VKLSRNRVSAGGAGRPAAISRGLGLVIAASALVAGSLAVTILADLRHGASDADGAEGVLVTIRHDSARPELSGAEPDGRFVPLGVPPAIPPWEATPENTPPESIPPGHIPAWEVHPPRPDPNQPAPPVPVPPPDPATHQPPMDNPGGVDGDRPPRPAPQ